MQANKRNTGGKKCCNKEKPTEKTEESEFRRESLFHGYGKDKAQETTYHISVELLTDQH